MTGPSRRIALKGAVAAGVSLLASACGERPSSAGVPSAAASAADTGPTGPPRRGGTLTYGVIESNQAGNLDAHKPEGTSGSFRGWALYSKLWEWRQDDTRPTLALAESAEPNADATEWVIRLQPGLEFHHGKTIDADDVIFSLRRLTDPQLASPYGRFLHTLQRDGIRKLDARTVRIPFAPGRGLVALPECWMAWGGIVPVDYHPVTNPVGAGPYRLKSFTPGQRSVFTRFANYHRSGQPYFDELHIFDFGDATSRLQALLAGQIDIAPNFLPEQVPLLAGHPRLRLASSPSDGWQSFDMNTRKPPFDNPLVRQAFRLIADRDELVARVLLGHGRVANDLYSQSDPVYDGSIPQRRRNLAEARRLLASAGYPNGLEVELTTPGSNAALVFAQQAREAGVTVRVTKVDPTVFTGPNRGQWAFSTGNGSSRPYLLSVQQHDGPFAPNIKTNFKDERFTALISAALGQPDIERQKVLVHEAQRIQHDRGGLLIWGFADSLNAVARDIGGLQLDRTGFSAWRTDRLWRQATA